MTDLTATIAALKELRAARPDLLLRWQLGIDEAVEALEEAEKVIGPFARTVTDWETYGHGDKDDSFAATPTIVYDDGVAVKIAYATIKNFRAARAWRSKYEKQDQ